MKTLNTQKGFTLVELAIVMTIIGLLIGGILKGQELVMNAKVAATISQIRAYEAAVSTFRDKYDEYPGDMNTPATKLPGCTAANCTAAAAGRANNIIGNTTWSTGWASQAAAQNETVLFWTHLLLADMISGVTTAGITSTTWTWGSTHPVAKIGGGFVVGNSAGGVLPGAAAAPPGLILAIAPVPNAALTNAPSTQVLAPARAAQLDRKMDDGGAFTGSVQGYGSPGATATSCFNAGVYIEANAATSCGLVFRIQG